LPFNPKYSPTVRSVPRFGETKTPLASYLWSKAALACTKEVIRKINRLPVMATLWASRDVQLKPR
jgi:hypothetical protein